MKKKRNLKGMTLAEIIVSLAVVSVLTLVLVSVSTTITRYMRASTNINRKVAEQAPVAEVQDESRSGQTLVNDLRITVSIPDIPNSGSGTVRGSLYAVKSAADVESAVITDVDGSVIGSNPNYFAGDNLNLKYGVLTGPLTVSS